MEVTASGIEVLAVEGTAAHECLFREVVPTLVRDGKNPGRARRRRAGCGAPRKGAERLTAMEGLL
jgi:hypothetical protein